MRYVFFSYFSTETYVVGLSVLRFYGPLNPIGSCRARSVYLTTHLLDSRAQEILKSESVQPMTMTSSMSPFPKKKKKKYHLSRKLMTIGSPITPFK